MLEALPDSIVLHHSTVIERSSALSHTTNAPLSVVFLIRSIAAQPRSLLQVQRLPSVSLAGGESFLARTVVNNASFCLLLFGNLHTHFHFCCQHK